jgi:hypothetical protein
MRPINLANTYILFFCIIIIDIANAYSQQAPTCDIARYKDQYTENQSWNNLVLKACEELQRKEFEAAYVTLRQVITEDSINSNGIKTAYLETQLYKIGQYINDNNLITEENKNETPKQTEPQAKKEELKKEEKQIEPEKKPEPVVEKLEKKTETSEEPITEKKEAAKKVEQDTQAEKVESKQEENENKAVNETNDISDIKFTDQDKAEFQEKGLQKVKQLETFIAQIGSKSTPANSAQIAKSGALKLFDSEERTVQVSSSSSGEIKRSKIKVYLQKLRMLNYANVSIEWADFQYASDFKKGLDGNYYGYIVFKQRFTASSLDNQINYKDLTTKKIEVILKSYEKAAQGEITQSWDIFLGDISVVQTEVN